jgi:hypothetical protein
MNDNVKNSKAAPVYVPYATMISALDSLRNHGIPASGKIDKSIWESQSGSVRGQLILAFRFLGLIDYENRVQPSLLPIVAAPSMMERKPLLKKIIEDKYRDVIALDLNTISLQQLRDAFTRFDISGSTLTSATRFFIKACAELGIPIAKRFSEKTRSTGTRKKRSPNGSRRVEEKTNEGQPPVHHANGNIGTWEAQLLNKFPTFDPAWSEELKGKWFEGFGRLMGAKAE